MADKVTITIDSIVRDGQNQTLTIKGWALEEKKQLAPIITFDASADVKVDIIQFYRMDVNILFDLPNEINVGFEIKIAPNGSKGNVSLHFEANDSCSDYIVSLGKRYPIEPGTETPTQLKLSKVKKGLGYLKRNGLIRTIQRYKLEKFIAGDEYRAWITQNETWTKEDLEKAVQLLDKKPLISIIVPVFNVEIKWLVNCIESVKNQVYSNWELCICDDASTSQEIKKVLENYTQSDSRINVLYREVNGHISVASNDALQMATGEFVALLDNDDELSVDALLEVVKVINASDHVDFIYSDEDKINESNGRFEPAFKPEWSPDLLLGTNYISHLSVFRRSILTEIGGFRKGIEGSQDYDLVLRFTEAIPASHIKHIPKILYHWRALPGSTALTASQKTYANDAGIKALEDTLKRREIKGTVSQGRAPGFYKIAYDVLNEELVSIIIPTRNGYDDVKTCVDSIIEETTYSNYEIILADNDSDDPKMDKLYQMYKAKLNERFIVDEIDIPFNYSRINNIAAKKANGKYLLFLNNDTKVMAPDWLTRMVSYGQFDRIGCVGAKLYYPDKTIQHAGVVMGLGNVAGHGHHYFPEGDLGYYGRLYLDVDYLAVTAACVLVKKADFFAVNGFDEEFTVAFNDVDLCLKIYELGRYNVWVHQAELYHFESKSRGYENTPEKLIRFDGEKKLLQKKWQKYIDKDPFYSPHLTRGTGNFTIRIESNNSFTS